MQIGIIILICCGLQLWSNYSSMYPNLSFFDKLKFIFKRKKK